MRRSVVLPEPLAPSRAMHWPAATSNERSSRTTVGPKDFRRRFAEIISPREGDGMASPLGEPVQTACPDYRLIARSRAIRSSIGGWVENKVLSPPAPRSGLTMNRWAVAGVASMGANLEAM